MTMFGDRTATPAPAAPPRSRYGGINCVNSRDPMLGLGRYRVKVLSCAEGFNPGKRSESYKVTLQVVASEGETPVNSTVVMIYMQTTPGLAELKRFAMHAAGFGVTLAQRESGVDVKPIMLEKQAAYTKLDESFGYDGAILEASAGKGPPKTPSLKDRLVDVIVQRGKDVPNPQTGAPTGDYFRVYVWGLVPEAEQTGGVK